MWNLKYNTNEHIYERETDSRHRKQDIENKRMVTKGERRERDELGIWD